MKSDNRQVGEVFITIILTDEATTETHLIVEVLDSEAFAQVSEDLRTVFFEFEMSRKVFSVGH